VLQRLGRIEEAIATYRQALVLQPDYFEALNNLGNVLQACGHIEEAEAAFRQCVRLRPDGIGVGQNLANILHLCGRLAEAEQEYRRILAEHDQPAVHSNLGATLQAQGRIEEALQHFHRAAELMPAEHSFHSNLLLGLNYTPGVTAADLAAAHAEWQERHAVAWKASWRAHENSRDPERTLRLGFVSGDLWEHPVGHLVAPLLEQLDRRACQVICYYDNARNDRITVRIRNTADLWRSVCGVPDQALAEQIRADGVDVLFDLAGHTALNRLGVFARKPAPLQITWAGYVGTTGLEAMDYLLADRFEVPEGAEVHYRESILRMPDGYICYGPPADVPEVGPLPALAHDQFTFGSFNNPAKLNAEVVALWSRVLGRVPNSRLMFKYRGCDNVPVQDHFRRLFAQHGIGPERLEFVAPSLHCGVFTAYNQVDLGLDPFPYSGGLTTCEALWMGVPVITCPGSSFASRHTLTHLSNAGLGQFVARDFEHYVELAAEWAGDLPRLAALRAGMRAQVAASPLCDTKRFAANFQRVIRAAWHRWARQ
jgi:predicted O-linked N-acetylglucosamine transferase (SPINDLY family)